MTKAEQDELRDLDAAERAGQVLTGGQRGRLADLRRADILAAVQQSVAPSPVPTPRPTI